MTASTCVYSRQQCLTRTLTQSGDVKINLFFFSFTTSLQSIIHKSTLYNTCTCTGYGVPLRMRMHLLSWNENRSAKGGTVYPLGYLEQFSQTTFRPHGQRNNGARITVKPGC